MAAAYPPRRVLMPTDFSEGSLEAFRYAVKAAAAVSARLFILHVMERSVYSMDFAMTHPDISPEVRRRTADLLAAWVAPAKKRGVVAKGSLVVGIPFEAICREAKRRKADVIIMGTHGRTGLAHLMLGSNAERVVRLAPCPVVTVKASARTPAGISRRRPPRRAPRRTP